MAIASVDFRDVGLPRRRSSLSADGRSSNKRVGVNHSTRTRWERRMVVAADHAAAPSWPGAIVCRPQRG